MSTLLEKANQILTEKETKILPSNIKSGVTAFGVEGTLVELQGETKTVTPTTSQQVITPSVDKNGITQVTVSAVDSTIDNNIVAGNIKSGTTILGVEGTLEGEKYNLKDSISITNTILNGSDTSRQLDIKNTLLNEENMCTQTFIDKMKENYPELDYLTTDVSIPEAIIKLLNGGIATEHDLESLYTISFFDSNPDLKFYNRRWRYNGYDIQEISFDELNYILDAGLIINQARGGSYSSSYYYDCTYYFKVPKGQTLPYCDDMQYWLVEQVADLSEISGENIKAQISIPDIVTYSDNNYDYWCFLYMGSSPIYLTVLNKLKNLKSNDMNFGVINTYVD